MKISSIHTIPADPVIVEYAGTKTQATSQKNADKTRDISQQKNPLVQEDRSSAGGVQNSSREEITKKLDRLNKQLEFMNRSIRFSIDEDSQEIVVRVVDKRSGEVITQLPPDDVLKLKERLDEMAGLLVEKTI